MNTRYDPERELDHLAQWLPFIEGIASSPEPKVGTEPQKRGGRKRRLEPTTLTAIPKSAEPSINPTSILEEHGEELSRAVRALRCLEYLLADESTRNHAIVLWIAYVAVGSEFRKRLDHHGGTGLWVALVATGTEQHHAWVREKGVGIRIATTYGNRLLDAARAAWHELPPEAQRGSHRRGVVRYNDLREMVDRRTEPARELLSVLRKAKGRHVATRTFPT